MRVSQQQKQFSNLAITTLPKHWNCCPWKPIHSILIGTFMNINIQYKLCTLHTWIYTGIRKEHADE